MQPTQSDVHVNALLSNLSLMYMQEEEAFVAHKVFPIIPVEKQSDKYVVYSRADFNRNTMRKRAASTQSAGGGYRVDTSPTYFADVWALHKDIDDQVRANADAIFNLESEASRFLVSQALINREQAWATTFFGASIWTTDWSGVASSPSSTQVLQWNDPNSQPIIDIRNMKRTIQLAGTFRPNKLILGRPVFDTLCDHPDFVDRIKYGQTPGHPAKVTLDAMAGLFELDEVLVMDAIVNNGGEGAGPDSGGTGTSGAPYNTAINAVESNAFIGNKGAMLCYTPSAPGVQTPGCGYTFAWTGMFGMTTAGERIKTFYEQAVASTRVEIESAYVHKLVSQDLGGFINTVIA